tara:strand:+ start:618 stop:719 length:102 start_codon:yes stop_codon:yes gene_type:complete
MVEFIKDKWNELSVKKKVIAGVAVAIIVIAIIS